MPNATVEIWATSDSLNVPDGSSLRQEQNKLLDQATDPLPDRFVTDQEFGTIADRQQGVQPLVHTPADWEEGADTSQFAVQRHRGAEGLDVPRHTPTPGEEYVISCWDLTEEPTGLLASEDSVDSKWMGQTSDCTVTIRQLGPDGSAVEERTVDSEVLYKTTNWGGTIKKHHGVRWTPQQGVYEITTSQSDVKTYVAAGGVESLKRTFEEDLNDKADSKAERAKELAQLRNDKKFSKIAVESNATGHWSADVPDGYSYVAVTARKGTDQGQTLLADTSLENRTMQEFRTQWESAAQTNLDSVESTGDPIAAPDVGSVYLSTEPKRVEVPSNQTVVRVREIDSPTYNDPGVANNFSDLFSSWISNQSQEELQSFLAANGLNTTETNQTAQRLEEAMQRNDELRQRLEDNGDDGSSDEQRLAFLEKLIMQHGSTAAPEDTEQSVGQTTDSGERPVEVTLTYPSERFGDSLATSNWTVIAHDSTGDERIIDDQNVTVDRSRASGTVDVTISDTLPSSVASTRYEVVGIGEQDVTRSSATVENPDAAGSAPGLESIGISSTRPGPSDRVTMTLHPSEDSSFARIADATVYQPDGTTSQATVDGNEISFNTNGSGGYAVDVTAENTKGTPYHETLRVHAGSADVDMPPGIRMRDTQFGTVAIGSDGVQQADVDISDDRSQATIGAQLADGTDLSNGIHVYSTGALSGSEQTINVRALDSDGRQLGQSVGVTIHHDDLSEDALIYRNGDPAAGAAKVVHGSNASAATSIQTVTDSDGTVEIKVDRDPSLVDRVSYRVRSTLTSISLPTTTAQLPAPSAPAFGGLAGVALAGGLARRSRGGQR